MIIADEAAMLEVGARLAQVLRCGDAVGLSGGLGVGKTTLARGLLAALGLEEEAPSPSFALVQPYAPPDVRLAVAHVDLYRLEPDADIGELGLDDYLQEGAVVIEWPERMAAPWPNMLRITIALEANGARRLTATVPPSWEGRWPPR